MRLALRASLSSLLGCMYASVTSAEVFVLDVAVENNDPYFILSDTDGEVWYMESTASSFEISHSSGSVEVFLGARRGARNRARRPAGAVDRAGRSSGPGPASPRRSCAPVGRTDRPDAAIPGFVRSLELLRVRSASSPCRRSGSALHSRGQRWRRHRRREPNEQRPADC